MTDQPADELEPEREPKSRAGLGPATVASALNPMKVAGAAVGAARLGLRIAGWTERQAMRMLRDRLDAQAPSALPASPGAVSKSAPHSAESDNSLDSKLQSLLHRAVEQSTRGGQAELFHRLLDQLVPDEARILGALADGSSSALVHVFARARSGAVGPLVVENASLIGRTAHLALPRMTDAYVTHLLSLRLVEIGPEDASKKTDYEILLAETFLLDAIKSASRGPFPARVERHTLRLSELGRALWEAAQNGSA